METKKCSICGKDFKEYGNNAQPVNNGICCDYCNENVVIPTRIYQWKEKKQWENLKVYLFWNLM